MQRLSEQEEVLFMAVFQICDLNVCLCTEKFKSNKSFLCSSKINKTAIVSFLYDF